MSYQQMCFVFLEEEVVEKKSGKLRAVISQKILRLFFSNLVCEVLNVSPIPCMNLLKIACIVFKLQCVGWKGASGVVNNNKLVCHENFLADVS